MFLLDAGSMSELTHMIKIKNKQVSVTKDDNSQQL